MADGILFIINWYWTQKIVEKRKTRGSAREVQEKVQEEVQEAEIGSRNVKLILIRKQTKCVCVFVLCINLAYSALLI